MGHEAAAAAGLVFIRSADGDAGDPQDIYDDLYDAMNTSAEDGTTDGIQAECNTNGTE